MALPAASIGGRPRRATLVDARDLATLERRGESAGTITGLGAQWIGAHRGWRAPMTTAFIDGLKGFTPTRGAPPITD